MIHSIQSNFIPMISASIQEFSVVDGRIFKVLTQAVSEDSLGRLSKNVAALAIISISIVSIIAFSVVAYRYLQAGIDSDKEHFEIAENYYNNGDWENALSTIKGIPSEYIAKEPFLAKLAKQHLHDNNFEDAEKVISEWINTIESNEKLLPVEKYHQMKLMREAFSAVKKISQDNFENGKKYPIILETLARDIVFSKAFSDSVTEGNGKISLDDRIKIVSEKWKDFSPAILEECYVQIDTELKNGKEVDIQNLVEKKFLHGNVNFFAFN